MTFDNNVNKRELVCNPVCVVDILVTELPKCLNLVRENSAQLRTNTYKVYVEYVYNQPCSFSDLLMALS